MRQSKASSISQPLQQPFQQKYQATESQGECLLESVVPVIKDQVRFVLYIISAIVFAGIPLLLIYWYPELKRRLYFKACPLNMATYFHVVNYDGVSTYPKRLNKTFYFDEVTSEQVTYFNNRYITYIVSDDIVRAVSYNYIQRVNELLGHNSPQKKSYTTQKDAINLLESYGPGVMVIKMPSIPVLIFREVVRPLYLFIIFSCVLWMFQQYYYYAGMIIITGLVGIITNFYQTYQNNKRIYAMAYHQEMMNVMRNGEIVKLSSAGLVPGDIVFLKNQIKIPFDGIILEGDALINQCALTGESVPVLKKPQKIQQRSDIKTSYIYEGTSLIQVGNKKKMVKFEHYREQYGIPVVVARTNFATMKGQLIRIISFPKERENVFERQSAKFLIFLFCLSVISYSILISYLHNYATPAQMIDKFLDLITITVPPGLPVSMTFGIIFALQKMLQKKIFCSSPNKVVLGGMTNWICFDKTGTLTEDFMDFNCLVLCRNKKFRHQITNVAFTIPKTDDKEEIRRSTLTQRNQRLSVILSNHEDILLALNNMAMNHTIVNVEETKENVGDPMEIKLFQFGNFSFSAQNNDNSDIIMSFESERGHKGAVYKRFDFDSQLFRMSSIGKSSVTEDDFYLYTKGSPELMTQIFKKQSVPLDYSTILKKYTSQGFRVLAIGSRKVQKNQLNNPRLQLQKDVTFDGFEVFENRLKPETKGAIEQLRNSQLPCVMITGDNALTGSNMACQCRISDPNKKTLICSYNVQKGQFYFEEFVYEPKEGEIIDDVKQRRVKEIRKSKFPQLPQQQNFQMYNIQTNNTQFPNSQKNMQTLVNRLTNQDVQLCISGEALDRIFNVDCKYLTLLDEYILMRTTVFARAKPNSKIKAIALYQKLGKKVAMCGDGANDCGALKQADIGLSLSMAEASISAPFTSQITNISSMIELIKQCRAGLATNFSLFNIMALYSLIQYTTTIITQYYFSYPSDFQYLYWDVFCNFIFFLTIGYTHTSQKLSKQIPSASLFSFSNLFQVMLAFGLQLVGQVLAMIGLTQIFKTQLGYDRKITENQFQKTKQFIGDSFQTNTLFLFSNMMYIMTLLAFMISKPWRKEFYTNPIFMISLVIIVIYSLVMIVVPQSRLYILQCTTLGPLGPSSQIYQPFLWYLFGLSIVFGVVIYIIQKCILEPMFNWLKIKYPQKEWL